ncbi:MAG: hypothetical protein HYU29_05620 [Chloroflexi bacterium]|nr:hypothetical protein [Chloroflexota bacterium]
MTVGIAAISAPPNIPPVIHFASDRMITVRGDFEYDAPHPKLYPLGKAVALLIAGETSTMMSVAQATWLEVRARGLSDVKTIADVCGRLLANHKRALAERMYLHPLGLTLASFGEMSSKMSPTLVGDLRYQLQHFSSEIVTDAIIAGIELDTLWPHLYRIDTDGNTWCEDHVGFSAIGIGARQAETQFMLQHYGPAWLWQNSLLLTHTAKKAAESAPGVGRDTDMHLIDTLQGLIPLPSSAIEILDKLYQARVSEEESRRKGQLPELDKALQAWLKSEQEKWRKESPDKT